MHHRRYRLALAMLLLCLTCGPAAFGAVARSSRYSLDYGVAAPAGGTAQGARTAILSQTKTTGLANVRVSSSRYTVVPLIGSGSSAPVPSAVGNWAKYE